MNKMTIMILVVSIMIGIFLIGRAIDIDQVRKTAKISLKLVDCHSNSHDDSEVCNLLESNDLHKQEHITLPSIVRKNLGLRDPVNGRINQQIRVGIDTNENGRIDETEEYAVYTVVKDYDRTKAAYMGKGD